MPAVSEHFKTYRDYASATLDDIYGDRLKKAYKISANHLQSGVWINETKKNGNIQFSWHELPWVVQLSPVNAIVSGDFNGDGNNELILAQNHYTNWVETGLWRGNPGCHLEWVKSGFKVIPYKESGILLPNDSKALITIDANKDGKPDVLAGQNNDKLLLFQNSRKTITK